MTVRKIVKYGTPSLREKSKEVHKISKKVQILVDDLYDTMYATNGVGLAAPQVGENLRVFVIDVGTDPKTMNPITFINPKIIKKEGAINSYEGCLSFPEAYTNVRRYKSVKIKALDIKGKPFILEVTDGSLLARAIQHEFDHLEGILFIDHCRNRFETDKVLAEKGLGGVDSDYLIEEKELEEEIQKNPQQEENN
ncbi:TPA: peptide deformylase [Candidatus Avigastranaerophilus faecigallinarum]|nr:peptide deformylase [Candidatus Avigastranaerophilus faecigallinarum]